MKGAVSLPGDKSLSHRVAMLAALANGPCRILNYNRGADCESTLSCLRQLGVVISAAPASADSGHQSGNDDLVISSSSLVPSEKPLDCGNSGSTMRMLTGLLAGQDLPAVLIGDLSLIRRPMMRLAEPLRLMGVVLSLRDEEFAPIVLQEGAKQPVVYRMPVPSAQVKSAILFAGIRLPGTRVSEPVPTRDHTERLFEHLKIQPGRPVSAFEYDVPGDPSAAAFFVVGALLQPDSELTFPGLLMNPHRVAFLRKIQQSGAPIEIRNRRMIQNELVADVRVRSGKLTAPIRITPEEVPSLVDEIPALSLLGTVCGFEVSGASELRFKECDRIEAMVTNLDSMSVRVDESEDGYRVWPGRMEETVARTFGDHRIAMTFAVAGIEVDDPDCVRVSFPNFFSILESVSANSNR